MESISALQNKIRQARAAFEKLDADLPRIMGAEAVRVVKENFNLQGYDTGSGVEAWEQRKEATNKAYDRRGKLKGSVYRRGNPLLMQTRNLYNSVRYFAKAKSVLIGVNLNLIPYAKRMNEQRKFMPAEDEEPSEKMLKRIADKIGKRRDQIFKDFRK